MNLYQNVSAHRKETFENEEIKIGLECGALEYDSKADSIRCKKEMATSVIYNSRVIHNLVQERKNEN